MKARNGFVSNSSSSSFIINIGDLSAQQLYQILQNKEMEECDDYDRWSIEADELTVRGSTSMDNYSMQDYLHRIGINMDKVRWGD